MMTSAFKEITLNHPFKCCCVWYALEILGGVSETVRIWTQMQSHDFQGSYTFYLKLWKQKAGRFTGTWASRLNGDRYSWQQEVGLITSARESGMKKTKNNLARCVWKAGA